MLKTFFGGAHSRAPLRLFPVALILILLIASPLRAQQPTQTPDYPTLIALNQTVVPAADYVALAEAFRGVASIPSPLTTVPAHQVGEQQTFWVNNSADQREFQVTDTLRIIGQHIYLWVENGAQVNDTDLQALADTFDNKIYDADRALWGSEASPGIDGDPRLYGLFAHGLGSGTAAYFLARNSYPQQVFPTSNEHEMFFFNLDAMDGNVNDPLVQSTVAHEFQHMIRANIRPNEDIWLNEGFSTFTELYLFGTLGAIPDFLSAQQIQLNTWSSDASRSAHYGAATLFVDYFYERYGLDALHALSEDPELGLNAFDHTMKALGKPGVNDFFADWVLANFLQQPATGYGYRLLPAGMPSPKPLAVVTDYPYTAQGEANQYAAAYYSLSNLKGKQNLDIRLDAPDTVSLLPVQPASGQWMWYSNKGDSSDPTLTHTFDLSNVYHATLSYRIWYSLEDLWDYGYVSVSNDGGKTWHILSTPHTTDENPDGTSYGSGYSGDSGGWQDETISLDAYAGKSIQVRFDVITDDAITLPGMALDDMSIPEIGYQSDFETDGGGWNAAGWIRTDNRLPQQVWVQAVQEIGKRIQVSRWLAPAGNHWTLPLAQGVDQVLIAISPFAPVTTTPMSYTLSINAS